MPEDRTALVTGIARGIGRWVSLTLAERGYRIAANDLEAPEATVQELERIGVEAVSLMGDIPDEVVVRGMAEAVRAEFGRIDVLVNNVGISTIVSAEVTALADWNRTLPYSTRWQTLCAGFTP